MDVFIMNFRHRDTVINHMNSIVQIMTTRDIDKKCFIPTSGNKSLLC